MTHKETVEKFGSLLFEGGLAASWAQYPEVCHIPFRGNREHFFLLVSLHLKQMPEGQEPLIGECLAVALLAIDSGLLGDEKAVEIAAYVEGPRGVMRVARLTVLDEAFDQVRRVEVADVLAQSINGITCQWPLQRFET